MDVGVKLLGVEVRLRGLLRLVEELQRVPPRRPQGFVVRTRDQRLVDERHHLGQVLVLGEEDEGLVVQEPHGPGLEGESDVDGPAGQSGLAIPIERHGGFVQPRADLLAGGTEDRLLALDCREEGLEEAHIPIAIRTGLGRHGGLVEVADLVRGSGCGALGGWIGRHRRGHRIRESAVGVIN